MRIDLSNNIAEVVQRVEAYASQVPFAISRAINESINESRTNVQHVMRQVFDRPTPWVLNSLRPKYSRKTNLTGELAFKDQWTGDRANSMLEPQIFGGERRYKAMEVRLKRMGYLPEGWQVVPGAGAKLDSYGNMSRGEISLILNVLGTYTEAGYNKANDKTRAKLAKGAATKRRNVYGYVLWVNKVDSTRGRHLLPGVYKRIKTPFGSSLKPVLIFIKRAHYKKRLNFFEIVQRTVDLGFGYHFDIAMNSAKASAIPKSQGALF